MFRRPSHQSRLASALLGALLLSSPAAPEAAAAQAPPPTAVGRPSGEHTGQVAALYRKAADAARSHERARLRSRAQRHTADRLAAAVRDKRREYGELRSAVGVVAASHYRTGIAPGMGLVLARSPEEYLDRRSTLRQGNRAAAHLLHTTDRARNQLVERERAAEQALARLRATERERLRVRRQVEAELVRAERRAAEQRAAARRAAARLGAARGSFRPALHRTGCPTGGTAAAAARSGGWTKPVGGGYRLTAGFGSQGGRWTSRHTGLDFAVPTGTPVRAVGPGVVARAGCGDAYGVQVVLRHADGHHTQYAHLSLLQVVPGQRVEGGQQIGLSGTTGNSSGPHLHFEARTGPEADTAVNPAPWLRARGVTL
ncbi:M23 family metallopeptidase [Streptomyces sp. OF3]|uniref:M23 family metallopeptidase n=1 Tax=Streptomyces alkaliterrae TaxID=2213162 RepID=A0A7W3WNZ9_9ACTN|nr:M23 family metallopeptidase [Streptomyces alkaliterrae]MBB1255856.1 M23 family metallopeptidase [Streptomyces alkaliterrae]